MKKVKIIEKKLKEYKLIIIVITIAMAVFSWIYFSPSEFFVSEIHAEWKEHNYRIDGIGKHWELGKLIAKDPSGRCLYAINGDEFKQYLVVAVEAQDLFIEYGYDIPEEGELTGIIAEYRTDPDNWISYPSDNRFFKKSALEEIVDQSLSASQFDKFESDKYIGDDEFYRIYLCYNGCPVSNKCIGYVGELEEQIYFLRGGDAIVGPSGTEDYKAYIKNDTEYFILDSKKAKKELKKIKTSFRH